MTISPGRTTLDMESSARAELVDRLFPSIQYELAQIAASLSLGMFSISRWRALAASEAAEIQDAVCRANMQVSRGNQLNDDLAALREPMTAGRDAARVDDLVRQSIAMARFALHQQGGALIAKIPGDLPSVLADRVVAQHVLLSLLLIVADRADSGADRFTVGLDAYVRHQRVSLAIRFPVEVRRSEAHLDRIPQLSGFAQQAGIRLCSDPHGVGAFGLSFPLAPLETQRKDREADNTPAYLHS